MIILTASALLLRHFDNSRREGGAEGEGEVTIRQVQIMLAKFAREHGANVISVEVQPGLAHELSMVHQFPRSSPATFSQSVGETPPVDKIIMNLPLIEAVIATMSAMPFNVWSPAGCWWRWWVRARSLATISGTRRCTTWPTNAGGALAGWNDMTCQQGPSRMRARVWARLFWQYVSPIADRAAHRTKSGGRHSDRAGDQSEMSW